MTDESRQTLSIRKTFQEGKLVFNKHKVMLKINLNIFYLSCLLVKSDIASVSTFYYLTIVLILRSLVIMRLSGTGS